MCVKAICHFLKTTIMATKIYGVKGLMEWVATIQVGKASVRVPFYGGSMSAFGVIPATYKTSDTVMQHIIEKSDYFKSGRIILVNVFESPEDIKETEVKKANVIKVGSIEDARDYLVDNFGATKSELRSRKAIEDCAKVNGVVFEGY